MFPNGQGGPSTDQSQPQQSNTEYPPHPGVPQQQNAQIFQVEPEAPVKKQRLLVGVIIGAVVLLIATAAILYIVLVLNNKKEEAPAAPLADLNSVLFVSDLRKQLKETYPQQAVAVEGKPVLAMEESTDSPVYIPEGYQYGVQYESETAFTFSLTKYINPDKIAPAKDDTTAPLIETAVLEYFKKGRLVQLSDVSDLQKDDEIAKDSLSIDVHEATLTFTGRGLVCSVEVTATAAKEDGSVRCGEAAEFKRLAAETQPFVESLTGIDRTMTLRDLKTVDSPTGGYRQASLKIIDSANKSRVAVFYKKDSGRWLSIGSSESGTLPCTDFTTLEMQRAYLGSPCLDAQNKSATVQIIEKRR